MIREHRYYQVTHSTLLNFNFNLYLIYDLFVSNGMARIELCIEFIYTRDLYPVLI